MRDRKKIEESYYGGLRVERLQLEVLLDIRECLQKLVDNMGDTEQFMSEHNRTKGESK